MHSISCRRYGKNSVRQIVKKFIINIDQTLVFLTSHYKQTLETSGAKRINIHTSTQDTRWDTLAVTVCVDSMKLPPMLIFKSKQNEGLQKIVPHIPN